MSFGLNDKDWVDPDPVRIIKCFQCEEWIECPCVCGYGWCKYKYDFTNKYDECEVD